MPFGKWVSAGTMAALLSGCATTLDVRSDSAHAPYAEGVAQALPFTQSSPQPARVAGIPYRINVQGRLLSCASPCARVVERERKTPVEGTVAQLGGVKVLPVRNPPLGSTAFSAQITRDELLARIAARDSQPAPSGSRSTDYLAVPAGRGLGPAGAAVPSHPDAGEQT
jgi:hypothetical protein